MFTEYPPAICRKHPDKRDDPKVLNACRLRDWMDALGAFAEFVPEEHRASYVKQGLRLLRTMVI